MADEEKAAALAAAQQQMSALCEGLAPAFVGRTCPLKNGGACDGPRCMWFAAYDDNPDPKKPNRITNGTCSFLLSAQQLNEMSVRVGDLARGIENLAIASNGPRLLKT